MQSAAESLASSPDATAPSSPTHYLVSATGASYYFFSAPASPVHYILRSPPCSAAGGDAAGDFEFVGRHQAAGSMSSAEELFVAGRIRVGRPSARLSPIRQEVKGEEEEGDASRHRRARSASPPRSPGCGCSTDKTEPPEPLVSASSSMSSSSSTSTSVKVSRQRVSLSHLLGRTRSDMAPAASAEKSGFWPSIWSSKWKKAAALRSRAPATPPPQAARRSSSSNRPTPAPTGAGCAAREEAQRRVTSLPYRHGLLLGCLGLGGRSYGLAKSIHTVSSR